MATPPTTTLARFMSENTGMGPVEAAVELLGGASGRAAAITPSDTVDLANPTRRLYVGVAGDVVVILASGETVTLKAMPVGFHNLHATRIKAIGTTATNLLNFY